MTQTFAVINQTNLFTTFFASMLRIVGLQLWMRCYAPSSTLQSICLKPNLASRHSQVTINHQSDSWAAKILREGGQDGASDTFDAFGQEGSDSSAFWSVLPN